MDKRRIAVIVAGIDQKYQSEILDGMKASAAECGLDLSVFVSFIGTMENAGHDTGEFNIFSLPDLSTFDGAVLLTNTIDYPPVAARILSDITEAGIPAVSVDNDVPGMLHIGIDNKTAMREITEHFIKHHGFTRFNYISGPPANSESDDRLEAFLEVLKENNIEIDRKRIYHGDFRAPEGRAAIDYFLRYAPEMPEAIICANDVMAAAAIDRLAESGYCVPEDIAVSGFDHSFERFDYRIELTTVSRPLKLSGKLACQMLREHFDGGVKERSRILDMKPCFSESCGCGSGRKATIAELRARNYSSYRQSDVTQYYLARLNRLSSGLLGCSSFEQYITSLKIITKEMDPDEFYFCLCTNWNEDTISVRKRPGKMKKSADYSEYTEEMLIPIAYRNGVFLDTERISRKELIPPDDDTPGKVRYFVPLHFGDRCLGYMGIRIDRLSLHNTMFQSWCISISNSLENIRKLIVLECAVERLGKLYAQDSFSGIYNRNGFVEAAEKKYRDCVDQQRAIMVMFIDLDGLKLINDTFGHSVGDNAICCIAGILRDSCTRGEVYCRFGGDEFIVFAADYTEADAEALTRTISDGIGIVNTSGGNPFVLSASIGSVVSIPTKEQELFDFVTAADKKMYVEKQKKHSKYLKQSSEEE
ncbi:MAG: GGDEF domain-containing protein [Ruminococcus sp.]|nr:GGDEF domain-containing protein [Ruminococcus sp.]